jgi:hypothetical protein
LDDCRLQKSEPNSSTFANSLFVLGEFCRSIKFRHLAIEWIIVLPAVEHEWSIIALCPRSIE